MPVIVSLASWCPEDEDLDTWPRGRAGHRSTRTFAHLSPARKSLAGATVLDNHMLLPILDGLDERPQESRWVAIFRINEVLKEHAGNRPLPAGARTTWMPPGPGQPGRRAWPGSGVALGPRSASSSSRWHQRMWPTIFSGGAQDDEVAARRWDPVVARLGSDCPARQDTDHIL